MLADLAESNRYSCPTAFAQTAAQSPTQIVSGAGIYNRNMLGQYDFESAEFDDAVHAATHRAFVDTLAAGLPVFYVDGDGINVMQLADGSRFEIRWLPGAPSGQNYETVRRMTVRAA